jgi:hypothetical protein
VVVHVRTEPRPSPIVELDVPVDDDGARPKVEQRQDPHDARKLTLEEGARPVRRHALDQRNALFDALAVTPRSRR